LTINIRPANISGSRTPKKVTDKKKTPEKVAGSVYSKSQTIVEANKINHLLRTVSIQAFIKGKAKRATCEKDPNGEQCSQGLLEFLRKA